MKFKLFLNAFVLFINVVKFSCAFEIQIKSLVNYQIIQFNWKSQN